MSGEAEDRLFLRETFERVRTHLSRQGEKAVFIDDSSERCRYRTDDPFPLRCAVGCLIKDGTYRAEIEGAVVTDLFPDEGRRWVGRNGISSIELARALNASHVPAFPAMKEMLKELQWLHDQRPIEEWQEDLERIRDNYLGDP